MFRKGGSTGGTSGQRGQSAIERLRQRFSALRSGATSQQAGAQSGPSGTQQPVGQPQPQDMISTRPIPQDWKQIWTSFGQPELAKLPQKAQLSKEHRRWLKQKGYKIGHILGAGSYGTVYEARQFVGRKLPFLKKNKVDMAVKVNSLGKFYKKKLHQALDMMTVEADLVRRLDHPNVVKRINVFSFYDEDTIFPFPIHTLFFMELMKGDLNSYMMKYGYTSPNMPNNNKLTEDQAQQWFKQIVNGLKYLHDQDIAHCDIKLENILYDSEISINFGAKTEKFTFKLTDFGLSMNVAKKHKENMSGRGTPFYRTPEARLVKVVDVYPTDIYALGVALMMSVVGTEPLVVLEQILKKFTKWGISAQQRFNVSTELATLWEKMVCHDPQRRITIERLQSITSQW